MLKYNCHKAQGRKACKATRQEFEKRARSASHVRDKNPDLFVVHGGSYICSIRMIEK